MARQRIEIRTEDGVCPAWELHPDGKGPLPGVILFMDGIGMRPALVEMGERLANGGYHVLLPDMFYRAGPYEPMNAKTVFTDPAQRAELFSRFIPTVTVANVMRDTRVFLDHLAQSPQVNQKAGVGTTGYCMGGRLSFLAAGNFPDRIVAAAAFHPGGLVTDAPDSPHLLAPKIHARIYVAGAIEDANFTDEHKARLVKALTAANVRHVVETYPARHGWVPPDTAVHDPEQAERHWKALFELFGSTLSAG
ncbi:MAG: dienelactone hydrolase family protein [Myxococcaceae bacterium]|nr:dienelactone hydrolase family protein [Myxococcaceae bacterium]